MSNQTRQESLLRGKLHFGALLRGKNALRSVAVLLAVITIGGFLASGTNQIVAQEGAIEL